MFLELVVAKAKFDCFDQLAHSIAMLFVLFIEPMFVCLNLVCFFTKLLSIPQPVMLYSKFQYVFVNIFMHYR